VRGELEDLKQIESSWTDKVGAGEDEAGADVASTIGNAEVVL
jgi:hypothetical protein